MTKNGPIMVENEQASGAKKIYNANGNPDLRALWRAQFDEALKMDFLMEHMNFHIVINGIRQYWKKDWNMDEIISRSIGKNIVDRITFIK